MLFDFKTLKTFFEIIVRELRISLKLDLNVHSTDITQQTINAM